MTTTTPRWLERYTTASGLPDPRIAGTTAKPRHCAICRRVVLAGYDAPLVAGLAVVDPYRLGPQLEAAAVILAIPTWQLAGAPGRYELISRHYPGVPPLGRKMPASECVVVAAHRCGFPSLSSIPLPDGVTFVRPTDPPY